MERTSSISRKAMAGQQKAEMMIAGEQLRLKLHDGKLIKDRRYHLRTYPNCFIAQELIDWLLSHKEAPDRAAAVGLMQHLMDHDIIHHVCDKRPVFKDAKLLYRFRKDDGTFPFNTEVKIFMHGQRLYEHLTGDKNSILQLREEHGVSHQRSFPGCQLIDWLLQNGEAESRRQGLELCRALQEHGIIQHGKGREALVCLLKYDASQKRSVTGGQCWESWETKEVARKHHFFDSGLLYQFCINFRRRRRLFELLNSNEHENDEEAIMATQEENHPDSPLALHKSPTLEKNSAFQSVVLGKELKPVTGGRRTSLNSTGFPPPVQLFSTTAMRCNPKSVLRRNYTCEELLQPGAPFAKKVLTVIGDDLGWGFVIRGRAPCYVQAVDPGSPAAAAGVKVRQFVCQVNGHCVLYLDYRTVSRLVMTGHRTVELEVMEPLI